MPAFARRSLPIMAILLLSNPAAPADAVNSQLGPAPPVDYYGDPLPKGAVARLGTLRLRNPINRTFSPIGFSAVFGPDAKTFASTNEHGVVHLWDAETGKEIRSLGHDSNARLYLLGGMDADSPLCEKKKLMRTRYANPYCWFGTWGQKRNGVGLMQNTSCLRSSRAAVTSLNFSSDGRTLFSGEGENWRFPGKIIPWSRDRWRIRYEEGPEVGFPRYYPLSPDHTLGVVRSHMRQFVRDTRTGKQVCELELRYLGGEAFRGFFTPDNRIVAMPVASRSRPEPLQFMDAHTGKKLGVIQAPAPVHHPLLVSCEGKAAWHASDGNIQIAHIRSGERWFVLPGEPFNGLNMRPTLAFSPDGQYLASWHRSTDVVIWDVVTGKQLRRLRGDGIPYGVALAFSPDSRLLAAGALADGADNFVQVWEVNSAKVRHEFHGHLQSVNALAFSPDGRLLASGSGDTTVLIWDVYPFEASIKPAWSAVELERFWLDLGSDDAQRAGKVIAALVRSPRQAESLLKKRLQRPAPVEPKRLTSLLADLDSPTFATRDKASRELAQLAELAEPALRPALRNSTSLELRQRVQRLLAEVENIAAPKRLREARSMEILEFLGTSAARKFIEYLAEGAADARLTLDAVNTLRRLKIRR